MNVTEQSCDHREEQVLASPQAEQQEIHTVLEPEVQNIESEKQHQEEQQLPTEEREEENTCEPKHQQEPQIVECSPMAADIQTVNDNAQVCEIPSPEVVSPRKNQPSPSQQKMKKLLENTKVKCQSIATKIKSFFSKKPQEPSSTTNTTQEEQTEQIPLHTSIKNCQELMLYSDYESQKTNFHAKLLLLYYLAVIQHNQQTPEKQQENVTEIKNKLTRLLNEQWNMSVDNYMVNSIVGQVIQNHNFLEQMLNRKVDSECLKELRKSGILSIEDEKEINRQSSTISVVPCQCEEQRREQDPTSLIFQVAEDGRIFVNIVDNTKSCA